MGRLDDDRLGAAVCSTAKGEPVRVSSFLRITNSGSGGVNRVLSLEDIKRYSVLTGIQGAEAQEPTEDGTPLVVIAAANELGTDRIPSRPFLRSTMDEQRAAWAGAVRKDLVAMLAGRATPGLVAGRQGVRMKRDVQSKIRRGPWQPNAPATLAQKSPRTRPLIDTGNMRQSIRYAVFRNRTQTEYG